MNFSKISNIKKIVLVLIIIFIIVTLVYTLNSNREGNQTENTVSNISYVNVLIFNGEGANTLSVSGLENSMNYSNTNNLTPNVQFKYSTIDVINTTSLSAYDVLVMPGGDYLLYLENPNIDSSAIKNFVASGKGYVGICAGSYVATSNYGWGIAPYIYGKYVNFGGTQQVTVTTYGSSILNYSAVEDFKVENGPIMYKSMPYNEEAKFTSNNTIYGNSSAILDDTFGNGRVMLSSAHIEQTNGKPELLIQIFLWVSKKI